MRVNYFFWGEKQKNRMFAPTGRKEERAGLEQKSRKAECCSKLEKREVSWIGAKESKRGTLLQAGKKRSKPDWSKRVEKRNVAPTGRRKKQAGLEQRDRKQDIYSNKKKRREKQVGVTKQKKKNCSNKRNT